MKLSLDETGLPRIGDIRALVVAIETGGRWSEEAVQFMWQLAPGFLTQQAALAWERRWTCSVRVVFCRVIGGTNVARVVVRDRRGPTNNCGRPFSRRSVVILCADIFPIFSPQKKRKCHWTKVFLDEFFFCNLDESVPYLARWA